MRMMFLLGRKRHERCQSGWFWKFLVWSAFVAMLLTAATNHFCTANSSSESLSISSRLYNSLPFFFPFQRKPKSWSSLLTVDPAKILSTLVKRGGLLIPKYIEQELQILTKVCRVDESRLNVVDRQLEFTNLVFQLKDNDAALRIGRLRMTWDSYRRPSVEIEVEQVEVLMEFTNLMLTRNNWNELNDAGFPPSMIMSSSDVDDGESSSSSSPSFVRIGSIDFSGNVVVRFHSRPLNKPVVPDLILSLAQVRDLSREIQRVSQENVKQDGRPGCTTTQLYDVCKDWFQRKFQSKVQQAVLEIAATAGTTTDAVSQLQAQAKQMASGAHSLLKDYVQTASNKVLQDKVERHLGRLDGLIPPKQMDQLSDLSRSKINKVTDGSLVQQLQQSKWFRNAYEALKDDTPIGVDKETHEFPQDVQFPDW